MQRTAPTSARLQQDETGGRRMVLVSPNPRRNLHFDAESDVRRKRQKLDSVPNIAERDQLSEEEVRVLSHGESGSTEPSKWYHDAQKNISTSQQVQPGDDDEQPYYIGSGSGAHYLPSHLMASHSGVGFGSIGGKDSENEDLRGVIDDLTLENKRLRHVLRSERHKHASIHTEQEEPQDKLFEVRLHGLPPKKRRELEYLLKNFAASVHTSTPKHGTSITNTSEGKSSIGANMAGKGKLPTDSGYASNTANSNSGAASSSLLDTKTPQVSRGVRNSAIKSYLHDIPDTLLPRRSPMMSERAKMALIVRRLEQLFTGRKAGPGTHHQPLQQQEVSQSAARADLIKDNRKRKPEGRREAKVMAPDTKVNLDTLEQETKDQAPISLPRQESEQSEVLQSSRAGSPDQRPTRPLDLDIHRAQVAAENMQYIQHLGLSSTSADETHNEEDGGPWVFLNLLTGMAQLHTINVTPELVRRAITRLSKRFELSKDGTRVRWTGGLTDTKFTQEDEKAIENAEYSSPDQLEDTDVAGSSRRSKTDSDSNLANGSNTTSEDKTSGLQTATRDSSKPFTPSTNSCTRVPALTKQTSTSTKFDYKPIVLRGRAVHSRRDNYMRNSEDSFDSISDDSEALTYALSKSNLHQKTKEEGLITFYNNPFWCSDFSADNNPSNMKPTRTAIKGECLGLPVPHEPLESALRSANATYFTPEFAAKPYQPQSAEDEAKMHLNLPALTLLNFTGSTESYPVELEACGLGGTTPANNFVLDVQVTQTLAPRSGPYAAIKTLPFSRRRYVQKYIRRTTACRKIDLLPSKLPPPSYIFFTSSSSSDVGSHSSTSSTYDSEDSSSSSPFVDEEFPTPPAFLAQFSRSSADNTSNDDSESDEIDMLALARRTNPEAVAAQERAYLINEPGGPRAIAGSLAATVGASVDTSLHGDEVERRQRDVMDMEAEKADGEMSEADADDEGAYSMAI